LDKDPPRIEAYVWWGKKKKTKNLGLITRYPVEDLASTLPKTEHKQESNIQEIKIIK